MTILRNNWTVDGEATPVLQSYGHRNGDDLPDIRIVGDRALLVDFAASTSVHCEPRGDNAGVQRARVLALDQAITRDEVEGVVECVVAYASLLVCYDPLRTTLEALTAAIGRLLAERSPVPMRRRLWRIPVCYGGRCGPDLNEVAARCRMSESQVVARHSGTCYTVAMFGFLPGFAYLAGLPAELAVQRRTTPRIRVPEGGIGIGGAQTAIGSIAGPSGWHQIGRTPVRTFAPARQPVMFLDIGDEVELVPIDEANFTCLQAAAAAGQLVAEVTA